MLKSFHVILLLKRIFLSIFVCVIFFIFKFALLFHFPITVYAFLQNLTVIMLREPIFIASSGVIPLSPIFGKNWHPPFASSRSQENPPTPSPPFGGFLHSNGFFIDSPPLLATQLLTAESTKTTYVAVHPHNKMNSFIY